MSKSATAIPHSASYALASKVKDYFILIKFTLSFMVVFSCVVCYLLAPGITIDFASVALLFIAGMLIQALQMQLTRLLKKIRMH